MPRVPQSDRLDPRFLHRWSSRALSPEPLDPADLNAVLEAARWAPSCFNDQPWHLVVADTEPALVQARGLLLGFNAVWAAAAPVLILVFGRRHFGHDGRPNRWGAFDSGAAWMSMALQADALGLVAHGMGGFNVDGAYERSGLSPESHDALCMVALGRPGRVEDLPEELRSREVPSDRKPRQAIVQRLGSPQG